jgi:DNA polymerase-3 subunit alpha
MDFLGLRNLDVLEIALDLVERSTGFRPDIDGVPLDDAKTFEMLQRGDTVGVFQLEGGPVRSLLRSLRPTQFEDVAALVALYRPGPMGTNMHTDYADRKNGRKPVTYYHPDVEEVLAPTYGLMIYQEQLMRVAQRLAGYSLEEADQLRYAAAKKKRDLMRKERSKFVAGCLAQGHTEQFAEQMFGVMEPFADYSFPKAHATGYGLIAYQTAYLKANYPVEYLAALLTSVKTNKDQTAVFLNECRQLGIEVLVPDVNESESDFSVHPAPGGEGEKGKVRFGMSAVRNVGEGVVAQVVAAREAGGPFVDFYDFCDRVDPSVLNKRTIESLVKAGGFDSLGHPRQGLVHVFETIVDTVIDRRRNEAEGQFDLFSAVGDVEVEAVVGHRVEIPDTEFPKAQRLAFEKEMLGLYVSEHPLMGAERSLRRHVDSSLSELREAREGELRTVGGIVTSLVKKYTRRGDLMGSFVLEDLAGVVEVMVFPRTMTDFGHVLEDDAIVVVKGRVDLRDDTPKLVAMEVIRPEIVLDGGPPVRIKVKLHALTDEKAARLKAVLGEHPGDSPVYVHLEAPEKTTVLRLADDLLVDPGNGLFAELRVLLGADCLA